MNLRLNHSQKIEISFITDDIIEMGKKVSLFLKYENEDFSKFKIEDQVILTYVLKKYIENDNYDFILTNLDFVKDLEFVNTKKENISRRLRYLKQLNLIDYEFIVTKGRSITVNEDFIRFLAKIKN